MKKIIIIIIPLFILIAAGCSKESKITYNKSPYTSETAINNGDVVNVNGKQYNTSKLEQFVSDVKKGIKSKIRITQYTTEGGAITTDLEFDGKRINYTYDNTRDGMGVPKIEKKKFNSNNLYKKDENYYLKSQPEDILIY